MDNLLIIAENTAAIGGMWITYNFLVVISEGNTPFLDLDIVGKIILN